MFSVPRLSNRFYLSFALVICIAAAILAGCDSNPSGSSSVGTGTTTTASATTSITGTTTLTGTLKDLTTGSAINSTLANIVVRLYRDTVLVAERAATNNNFYSFSNIAAGVYYLEAVDLNRIYEKNYAVISISGTTVEQNISLNPVPGATPTVASYTLFGRLVSAVDEKPVMFANVKIGTGDFSTTTLEDGTFIVYGLTEGRYDFKFSKTGFVDLTTTIVASTSNVFNGITPAVNGATVDGAGNPVTGKNVGLIKISPNDAATGNFNGRIKDPTTDLPVANTRLNLWYKVDNSQTRQPGVIYRPTTNSEGYMLVTNLPAGWYAITSTNTTTTPLYDNTGALVGYAFVGGTVYTGAFMQVIPGQTTTLPSD